MDPCVFAAHRRGPKPRLRRRRKHARVPFSPLRRMVRRRLRCTGERRSCQPHPQGERRARRKPVDVDAGLRAPRRSHANPRLRRKPRFARSWRREWV